MEKKVISEKCVETQETKDTGKTARKICQFCKVYNRATKTCSRSGNFVARKHHCRYYKEV